jgi:glycosyltransferase involved in cell wall biosynthesis
MDSNPLVSIIINNYNYDRFLAQAIDSILNQTYPYIETIAVDDGSTDNSRKIIEGYGDRIISIFQENGKQGKAFNRGFVASKGEIVIFLDSDDFLFPQAVERIVAVWKPSFAKVHYCLDVVNTQGESLGYTLPQGVGLLSTGEVWRTLLYCGGYASTPTSGNALSRRAMERVFPIPDEYRTTADDYLSYSIPFYGVVGAVEEPLGAYRIHDSNQWALTTVSGDRFRRFVHHDLQNFALLTQKAKEFGYEIPSDLEQRSIGRLWSRIISLRLDAKNHPIASDSSWLLIYIGVRSLWKYSAFNWQKRLIYSLWFFWVGLMPLPLAKPAITWLYAPKFRPKAIDWTVTKIRALVGG